MQREAISNCLIIATEMLLVFSTAFPLSAAEL